MSFSNDVKNELSRLGNSDMSVAKAELLGLLRMGGSVILRRGGAGVEFTTDNAALARRTLQILKTLYGVQMEVTVVRARRLKKSVYYRLTALPSLQVSELIEDLQLLSMQSDLKNGLLDESDRQIAFLRGVFLSGGSVSKPLGNYHLEMVTQNWGIARTLVQVLGIFSLTGKVTERKDDYVVYIKDGGQIAHFLGLIGATKAMLHFENTRVIKEMRNNVNRVVNCETANLEKTVRAAAEQLQTIRYIEKARGLGVLTQVLEDTARIRLEMPEAPLSELALHLGVSKSALNHRFKKIKELAVNFGMDIR